MGKNRANRLTDDIVPASIARARKTINSWRSAQRAAENRDRPNRTLYYNLTDELELDAHLSSEMQKRDMAIIGSEFELVDSNGDGDQEKTHSLQQPWFYDCLKYYMDKYKIGHTLIQVDDFEPGEIKSVSRVPKRHVIPEFGVFVKRMGDEKGIVYRDNPKYEPWLFEAGDKYDLGLLNKSAPYILYKRFALGAFSEFVELFSSPIRVAKTNTKDIEGMNRLEDMMIKMATSSYMIIDSEEEAELIEAAKSNGEVHLGIMKFCDNQISKLWSGSVIGEDSASGSRAKEEVGERTAAGIIQAIKREIEGWVNQVMIPKLIDLGYPLDGMTFQFRKSVDLDSLWKKTMDALNHYNVPEAFINETFNIPTEGRKQNVNPANLSNNFFD